MMKNKSSSGFTEPRFCAIVAEDRGRREDAPDVIDRAVALLPAELGRILEDLELNGEGVLSGDAFGWVPLFEEPIDQPEYVGTVGLGDSDDIAHDVHRDGQCDVVDEVASTSPRVPPQRCGALAPA